MNRVVHYEIHATDMEAMQKFYSAVFGWQMQQMGSEMGNYVVVTSGPGADKPQDLPKDPGINGGITPRKGAPAAIGAPVNAYVCIVDVNDIDVYIKKILENGGTEALAKMDVPGVGKLAYFHDPDHNLFGILQPAPKMSV